MPSKSVPRVTGMALEFRRMTRAKTTIMAWPHPCDAEIAAVAGLHISPESKFIKPHEAGANSSWF